MEIAFAVGRGVAPIINCELPYSVTRALLVPTAIAILVLALSKRRLPIVFKLIVVDNAALRPLAVVIVTAGDAEVNPAPAEVIDTETTFPVAFVTKLPVAFVPPTPAVTTNVSVFA